MPFYNQLQIRQWDDEATTRKKQRVASRLQELRKALKLHIEASRNDKTEEDFVRIATWNLRDFGSGKYEGRSFEELYYIAEIISAFDIVALQEVRGNLREFFDLKRILGPDWSYLATDVTDGSPGNGERMVFLFNQRKVHFRNIAGELTLAEGDKIRAAFGERIMLENGFKVRLPENAEDLSGTYDARLRTDDRQKELDADLEIPLPEGSLLELPKGAHIVVKKGLAVESPGRGQATVQLPDQFEGDAYGLRFPPNSFDDSFRQFARTPFLISFQAGWLKINLCTVHIYYGDAYDEALLEQRRSEIEMLTEALAEKADKEFEQDHESFMGVLGDFNIIGAGHPTMEALESNGFEIPEELKSIPGSNVARDKAYDQIAFWKPSRNTGYARLDIQGANIFDFFEYVFTLDDEPIYRGESGNGLKERSRFETWRTYKMSDHLPMWVELRSNFSAEYLKTISGEEE